MNKGRINIIAVAAAILALAGCTTTQPQAYSQHAPIMSADDAKAMIQVEVKVLQPATAESVVVAAIDRNTPSADRLTR